MVPIYASDAYDVEHYGQYMRLTATVPHGERLHDGPLAMRKGDEAPYSSTLTDEYTCCTCWPMIPVRGTCVALFPFGRLAQRPRTITAPIRPPSAMMSPNARSPQ
eukprot:2860408-Prymnesium_polylepis.1